MTRRPALLFRSQMDVVHDGLQSILGARLTGVTYAGYSADHDLGNAQVDSGGTGGTIHAVEMAVLIAFEGGSLRVDWAQSGISEGISVRLDSAVPEDWSRVTASGERSWLHVMGSRLVGVELLWHLLDVEAGESALGLRLHFDSGGEVMIAVGELDVDQIRYLPDELVVIFDPEVALAYVSPLVGSSSLIGERSSMG